MKLSLFRWAIATALLFPGALLPEVMGVALAAPNAQTNGSRESSSTAIRAEGEGRTLAESVGLPAHSTHRLIEA